MQLLGNAVLTVPPATTDPNVIYELDLQVSRNLTIGANATIDLNSKGFPAQHVGPDFHDEYYNNTNRKSCHAGVSDGLDASCVYGRYAEARFAGSGGTTNVEGGGVAHIQADSMIVEGIIRANGESSAYHYASAGGGIHIEANNFSGSSTGLLQARGGSIGTDSTSYRSGGGGRISVVTGNATGFLGDYDVSGGAYSSHINVAGAGTVYVHETSKPHGSLLVSNYDVQTSGIKQAEPGSTPIEHVGRHTITAVSFLGNNDWQIDVSPVNTVSMYANSALIRSGTRSVGHHAFSVPAGQTVEISVTATSFSPHIYIFRDDGLLDSSDYIAAATSGGTVGNYTTTFTLAAGNYIAAVGDHHLSLSAAINRSHTSTRTGDYQVVIATPGYPWRSSRPVYETGIQGLLVDLNAADGLSSLYTIKSNDAWGIVLNTAEDLSGIAGNELIGVHQFETISVGDGASVDFGGDLVEVQDLINSQVDIGSLLNTDPASVLP